MADTTSRHIDDIPPLRVAAFVAIGLLFGGLTAGCGEPAEQDPRDKWADGEEDPMAVPERYDDYEGPVRLGPHDQMKIGLPADEFPEDEKTELVLQSNVYVLEPEVAASAIIDKNQVVLPLEGQGYLARRRAGDIVISPYGDFNWRRIENVTFRDDEVHWETARPDVREVLKEAYFTAEVNLAEPGPLPTPELSEPYLSGPLEVFSRTNPDVTRKQRQSNTQKDRTCDKPQKCKRSPPAAPAQVPCGTSQCPCSNSACDGAQQCGGDGGDKFCNMDHCVADGYGAPKKQYPGTCIEHPAFDEEVEIIDELGRCSAGCNVDADCPGDMKCAEAGFCSSSCKIEGSNNVGTVGDNLLKTILDKLFEGSSTDGFNVTHHPYLEVKPNVRFSFDVDFFPPGLTIGVVAEADVLTGLGLLFEFQKNATWTLPSDPPAKVDLQLFSFNILGVPFFVKLVLHGRLKVETAIDGSIKLDFKFYSTRLETPSECKPDEDGKPGCDASLPWKDHDAKWSNYKSDHSSGDYSPPESESPEDPVIGTYAQDKDGKYGIAYGGSVGTDPTCMGYPKWCDKGGPGALISKRVTDSIFGTEVKTSVENYLTGEVGAQIGLYSPTPTNRILFIEPVNFLASAFAVFDPPFCGFGFDLFYRAFIGVGPLSLFGLISWDGFKLPFFSPIQILGQESRIKPVCYKTEGASDPLQPSQVQNWDDKNWVDNSFVCKLARTLAELDPNLACGAPAKPPSSGRTSQACSPGCPDGQTCFANNYCVPEASGGGIRFSLRAGRDTMGQSAQMLIQKPNGERVVGETVTDETQFQKFLNVTLPASEAPAGRYRVRVVNRVGNASDAKAMNFKLEIGEGAGEVQTIDGRMQNGEMASPFTFVHRHQQ